MKNFLIGIFNRNIFRIFAILNSEEMLENILLENAKKAVEECYGVFIEKLELQQTRKEFEKDLTLVLFPLLKLIKAKPEEIGERIGAYLKAQVPEIIGYNVVKGFLNIAIADHYCREIGRASCRERV